MKNRFKLSPPWCTYVSQLTELFGQDPEINVSYDNEESTVYIRVNNADKYEILVNIIPYYKKFGNVILNVEVIPANDIGKSNCDFYKMSNEEVFNTLFEKNPAFSFVKSVDLLYACPITYVVFTNKVVQFFNDNLNDVYGNMNTLYQNIAEDIFVDAEFEGVYYCTDIDKNGTVNTPLGEWP